MKKVMALLRYGLYILIWTIIAGVIALIISNNSTLNYKDAIFIEGILSIFSSRKKEKSYLTLFLTLLFL